MEALNMRASVLVYRCKMNLAPTKNPYLQMIDAMILSQYTFAIQKERTSMSAVMVHQRVSERHLELSEEDVVAAWDGAIMSMPRLPERPDEYVAMGFDGKGRLLEMVGVRGDEGTWLIFHATTPPSDKTFREFRIGR